MANLRYFLYILLKMMTDFISFTLSLPYSWKISAIMFAMLVYIVVLLRWKKYLLSKALSAFPELPFYPVVGSLHIITGNMAARVNKLLVYMKTIDTPIVFWFFYKPVIVLATLNDIQIALNKTYDRYVLGIFDNILKDGILLAQGERWRSTRRLMNPAFSSSMLQQYAVVFNEQAAIMTERLDRLADSGKIIDLWQYVSDMNFDTVAENMSDYKTHVQEEGGSEFSEAVVRALELESIRLNHPLLFPNFTFNIYKFLSGNKDLYEKVNNLPKEIVRAKIKQYELQKLSSDQKEKPMKTLMDLLLRIHDADSDFTEERMRIEILNMIFAGSDTTATTASFTLLLLAMHPESQQKVYEEILEVIGPERNVQMEDFHKLKYLEQCIKETLRRFSLVPITLRKVEEPIKLNDKQIIPENSMVALGYHAIHNNPDIFPDPDRWDPERFSSENNVTKTAFMGFGVGNRACIGSKYAMMSMKTQIVHIIRKYQLTSEWNIADVQPVVDIITRSQNGYKVKISRRNNNSSSVNDGNNYKL